MRKKVETTLWKRISRKELNIFRNLRKNIDILLFMTYYNINI